MPTTITGCRVARQGGYLSKTCHERIMKDNMPNVYPADLQLPPSMLLQGLFDNGNEFEDHIGRQLAAHVPAGELAMIGEVRNELGERTVEGKRQKEEDTFAAYTNPDVRIIFNPRLGARFEELLSEHLGHDVCDATRISEPDIIELGDMLPNGLRAMRFVDVKWHHITSGKTKNPRTFRYSELDAPYLDRHVGTRDFYGTVHTEDWRQLAHYFRHAQALGLVKPEAEGGAWAGVIGKEEIVVWGDLDALQFTTVKNGSRVTLSPLGWYDMDFADAMQVVANAVERDADPTIESLTGPEWKTDCAECPWRDVCENELASFGDSGHITLLAGVTPTRAAPLYRLGIKDIGTLARWDVTDAQVPSSFVYTARVKLDGHAHLAEGVEALDLPRGDVEVDFDCESEDTVYMWGVRVTDAMTGAVTEHMFDDYTGTEEGERRVFVECWNFFQSLLLATESAGRTVRFYHYSSYERTQMVALAKKYAGHPDVPTEASVKDFYDQTGAVVDLYEVCRTQVVWPTMTHSIKSLAPFAGFSWRDETPGGGNSQLWYRDACSHPDKSVRDANLQRLREYNLDDVHAQAVLREWVTAAPLPRVTLLGAPAR